MSLFQFPPTFGICPYLNFNRTRLGFWGFGVFCVIGTLKVSLAIALIAGIWYPPLTQPAAMGMGLLMLGAFVMHLKVKDPIKKALPSLTVLAMCAAIALL